MKKAGPWRGISRAMNQGAGYSRGVKRAGPFRGISRAAAHASVFVAVYAAVGMGLLLVAGILLDRGDVSESKFMSLMAAQLFSAILLWPSAVSAQWILLRLFRPRSWRHQAWRAWVAGSLAVPFTWIGTWMGLEILGGSSFLRGNWGSSFIALLLAVTCSNACVAIGWALPPWKGRRGRPSDPPSPLSSRAP